MLTGGPRAAALPGRARRDAGREQGAAVLLAGRQDRQRRRQRLPREGTHLHSFLTAPYYIRITDPISITCHHPCIRPFHQF